jgi:hypothetical protein
MAILFWFTETTMVFCWDPKEYYRRKFWNKLDDRGIESHLKTIKDVDEPLRWAFPPYLPEWLDYFTTHLHEAVTYSNNTLLATKILLQKKADLNIKNSYDITVLQSALYNKNCSIETIELLLKHGARIDSASTSPLQFIVTDSNLRPREEKIFLLKLIVQYLVVTHPKKDPLENLNRRRVRSHWIRKAVSIRNCCIRDWKSSLKKYTHVLYSFFIGEKILNSKESRALFDIYVKKKCPHFEELLKLVIGACNVNYLLLNVRLQNTFFAENVDCLLQIVSKLNKDDTLNFISAYWKSVSN